MPTLTPAYGRDYKSKKEVEKAIKENKDFVLNDPTSPYNGRYCSPTDFMKQDVTFRYAKLTKCFVKRIE